MTGRLDESVAVITGGASGIGESTVRRFVEEGAACVIADLQADRGEALAAELGDAAVFATVDVTEETEVAAAIDRARVAQRAWRDVPVAERAKICRRFTDAMVAMTEAIVPELAWQMGRPIGAGAGELGGFAERAGHMIEIAADALAALAAGDRAGFTRFIRREPVGVVLVVAAWNYPYLIAVNSVLPAIMAGNAVLLKHSAQTPLVAERFAAAFAEAGLPAGLFQVLHMSHQDTERAIANRHVDFVAFTGPVSGGHAI